MRHRSTAATADEISGHWWLPEATGRVAGRLVFPIDDAVRLELLGLLDSGEHERSYPVVLGLADDGTPITLADTTWIGGQETTSMLLDLPYRRETLMVSVAYIGAHLATEEDRHFTEGFVELSDLLTWAGPSGLNDRVESGPRTVAVELTLPEPREATLDFGTVSLSHAWGITGDAVKARGIEKDVAFWIRLQEGRDLDWWLANIIGPLRHFMTFAADRPNEIRDLTVRTYRYKATGDDVAVRYARARAVESPPRWWEFLFDARSTPFEVILPRWFELLRDIGPVIDVLLAQRYRPKVFAETRFLDAAISAETYHRARMQNESLPESQHQARLSEILDAAPDRHRGWLKERLAYSNEPTFRSRLKQLVAGTPARSLGVFGKPAAFADRVVNTRNTLVHDPRQRTEVGITGTELHLMAERLILLVSAHLLHDLGLNDEAVLECLRRTRRFRLLAGWGGASPERPPH